MALLLISYTIYTDTAFAYGSVVQQLFVAEIRPGTLEFSLYSLTSVLCIIGCNILFWWIRPRLRVSLESWLIIGYALSILIPVWGLIGLSDVDFGFKVRDKLSVARTSLTFLDAMGVLCTDIRCPALRGLHSQRLSSSLLRDDASRK